MTHSKLLTSFFALTFLVVLSAFVRADDVVTVYAGTLASPTGDENIPPSEGIYRMELNRTTGTLTNCGLAAKAKSPLVSLIQTADGIASGLLER